MRYTTDKSKYGYILIKDEDEIILMENLGVVSGGSTIEDIVTILCSALNRIDILEAQLKGSQDK